jgi:signal transduction histidine kinase
MGKIIDKGILLVLGTFLLFGNDSFLLPVLVTLLALSYQSLSIYLTSRRAIGIVMVIFVVASFQWNTLAVFLPALCYDVIWLQMWWGLGAVAVGAFPIAWLYQTGHLELWQLALWVMCMGIAVVWGYRTRQHEQMRADFIKLRDDSTELRLVMQSRQKELLEKQDYEIHLATLQERNRIAREIHDHVGHMLTRSILQMGALLTIHKEEPLQGQLSAVNDTLNEAMNNIRESVHDLHNESLDLRQTIAEAVDELKGRCEIAMEYDMTEQVPRNVKYCFVAIVKEAVANVIKHSNADQLTVILREHPGFYQMSIEDNGTQIRRNENPGIGLTNMTDRVEALHGTIRFLTEKGFRILISIPK